MEIVLREFIYYDREKIEDFLSIIEDGLVNQQIETRTEHGVKIKGEGGLKPIITIGAEKGFADNELQRLKTSTDASLFQNLYTLLKRENKLNSLEYISESEWDQLNKGDILELEAQIEFSGLSILFEKIIKFTNFLEQIGFDDTMDEKNQQIMAGIKILNQLTLDDGINVKITPVNSLKYKFVSILTPDNLKGNKQELIGEYKVMCRVKKIIDKDEKMELFNLIPGAELDKEQIEDFVKSFENMPAMFGPAPKMEDLQITYPAMMVTPIAIYR